jgi:hypothetical protein
MRENVSCAGPYSVGNRGEVVETAHLKLINELIKNFAYRLLNRDTLAKILAAG